MGSIFTTAYYSYQIVSVKLSFFFKNGRQICELNSLENHAGKIVKNKKEFDKA